MKDNISRKAEIKFFLAMVTTFFILPILIIQIPGIEKIGETILKPFNFILITTNLQKGRLESKFFAYIFNFHEYLSILQCIEHPTKAP